MGVGGVTWWPTWKRTWSTWCTQLGHCGVGGSGVDGDHDMTKSSPPTLTATPSLTKHHGVKRPMSWGGDQVFADASTSRGLSLG